MPKLDVLSMDQALLNSATGKRAQILREYIAIIEQVPAGQAGRLAISTGETLSMIKRRVGAAAKQTGQALVIRSTDEYVFFWKDINNSQRRRGRPPKNAT